jgi:zinc transporter 2
MYLNIYALHLSMKKAHAKMTYGYHRTEILGALISILVLWVLLGVIVFHAAFRLLDPPEIEIEIMLITASFGIVCNICMAFILKGGHNHSGGGHEGHSHKRQQKTRKRGPTVVD